MRNNLFQNLFCIDFFNESNHIKIVFLGIKFKILKKIVGHNMLFYWIDKLFLPFKIFSYKKKNRCYIQRRKKENVKRLFVTTGNLNLLNNIAIIKQMKLDKCKNASNDVLIWSSMSNPDFREISASIAKLGAFENYYFCFDVYISGLQSYILKNVSAEYDEIYFSNQKEFLLLIPKIFKNSKFILTDESVHGVCRLDGFSYDNISQMYFTRYLNKANYFGFNIKDAEKIVNLDKEAFLNLSDRCNQLSPFDVETEHKDKNIIFCGTYGVLKNKTIVNMHELQNKIINSLIAKGYKILFKPHPRDSFRYKENENFKILNTKLPLECYRLENILAIVALYSCAALQSYHYHRIPGFMHSDLLSSEDIFSMKLLCEYTPDYKILLEFDVANMSTKELKTAILKKYEEWLNNKPLLSENQNLKDFYGKITVK